MAEEQRKKITREAAEIFLQLREDPNNTRLQSERDAFCQRGQAEREAYDALLKTWKASGVLRAQSTLRSIILFLIVVIGTAYFAYQPVRIALLADYSTSAKPERAILSSGDIAFLDADSALIDGTEGGERRVRLLEGAAFFAVNQNGQPFAVDVGSIAVLVMGTTFEAALADDTVLVAVAEGRVQVRLGDQSWDLMAGNQLEWSEERGVVITRRGPEDVAAWRADRLAVEGMTLGQAAAIIGRRLTGPIVFTSAALRKTRVTGSLDLSQPLNALKILAQTAGADVYDIGGIGRIITEK